MADKFIFKWKPRFSPFTITYQFWIRPIPSYLKETPCALRIHSTCWCSQWKQYNTAWRPNTKYESTVGYNFRSFQGWPTNLYSNESLGSPFSEKHINFEFGQFLHTLKSLRVHLALIQLAGVLSVNNTIQLEDQKRNMNLRLGIILEVFKGGRQIYVQMKAQVLPFHNNISILNSANSFIP